MTTVAAAGRLATAMRLERLDDIIAQMPARRILVAGDLMLDEFVWGRVSRISPEAPVPIVEVLRESYYPGGAANVARNVRECYTEVHLMGLVGSDSAGAKLCAILETAQIGLGSVFQPPGFQTIVKSRIIARQQQVVRVDRERGYRIDDATINDCLDAVERILPSTDALILEDYGKGFFTQEFLDGICEMARRSHKIVAADPNPRNPLIWRGCTVVKPNRLEAFAAADEPSSSTSSEPLRDAALLRVGHRLLERWEPRMLLITLGDQGMVLFQPDSAPFHIPSKAREVFDLSGAGDTAIAFFATALVCGATPVEATEIANHASSVVVAKLGTATVTPSELRASFSFDLVG